jgi:coenzyme F420 biosynthesis associated uncharacterized protein
VIDWTLARRVGGLVAGDPPGALALAGDLERMTEDARERVVAYTGLRPSRDIPAPEPVARGRWLDLNLASMREVLDPLAAKLHSSPARAVGELLLAVEVGALAGYLSQRVLGQYELVLLDPTSPERLLFVAPNLREAAVRLDVDEEQLVAWVVFHEVTHAVQFTGVPWLREHVASLLRSLLDTVDVSVSPADLLRVPSLDDLRGLVDRVREGGLLTLVAGRERQEILDRVQATMAVVEGHAEHVMDAVGADVLPHLDELRAALDRRRQEKPPAVRFLERLIGMELKLRQYEVGRRFCDAVVERAGMEALNRVWEGPELLPTLAELEDPAAWLRRTAAAA